MSSTPPTSVIARLYGISKPYRGILVSAFLNVFANSIVETVVVRTLFAVLLVMVAKPDGLASDPMLARYVQPVITWVTHSGGRDQALILLTVATAFFYFLKCALDARVGYQMFRFANHMARDLRQRLFDHLMRLSPSHFERETTGSSLSRVTGDVAALQQTLGPQLADLAKAPLSILFGLAVMVSASWQLTLTVLIMAPVIAVVVGVGGRKIRKITTLMQERLGALNASLVERLANVRIIQSFVRERHESAQVAHFNEQYYRDTMRSVLVAEIIAPTSELIAAIGMLVGVIVGGLAVFHGQLTPSQFVLFLTMGQQVGSQFKHLTRLNQLREQANGAGARIFELLDIEPEIADAQRAVLLPPVQGRVTFEDVSFSYSTGAEVLSHVTLEVTPGEVIAVVGPTGSGKSTLVNLLPRFYDPTGGRILVDGHDVRAITLGSLRSQVGIVPQETVLFTGTIADNIRYGRLEASDAEVEEAARAAQALEFIVRQADGFDTMVGERGATLSGGQRQRVAIARALLKNPRILILDEATSALDTESEHLVQQALERLMQERTTFVIAHRLSTIQNATRIVVLEQGRIVEVGSHAALLAHDGLYRRLYDMQFRAAVDLAAEAPISATP